MLWLALLAPLLAVLAFVLARPRRAAAVTDSGEQESTVIRATAQAEADALKGAEGNIVEANHRGRAPEACLEGSAGIEAQTSRSNQRWKSNDPGRGF